MTRIYLGSSSKSRLDILQKAGYECVCCPSDVEEKLSVTPTEIKELVAAYTRLKTDAVLELLREKGGEPKARFLLCGDCLVFNGNREVYGKPKDEAEALKWLASYNDLATVGAASACEITDLLTNQRYMAVDEVEVRFHSRISEEDYREMLRTTNAMKAAGGLLSEHPLFSSALEPMDKRTNEVIMGLSSDTVNRLIEQAKQDMV